MTTTDKEYLRLLRDIIDNGVEKDTRAGKVKSVFGRQIRFDLKEGIPLLTTKKVFTKGVLHELLWFLQRPLNTHGSMNIEYLVRNGVHIWDDDAYRWFKTEIAKKISPMQYVVCTNDDDVIANYDEEPEFEEWEENKKKLEDNKWLETITKEEFLELTLKKVEIQGHWYSRYRFGDLGPVYGKQWRCFGSDGEDQIEDIITTLRVNPNDRRMLCVAFNPDQIRDMALPPCHVMFQFYTRELTDEEKEKYGKKYGLSCMWVQRSVDTPIGLPYNILSYSMLTHMIAKLVDMVPDELIGSLGDTHIYLNQMDGVKEQLERNGSDIVPQLLIKGEQKTIEDFKFEDFEITDYHPDPTIKFQLNVG